MSNLLQSSLLIGKLKTYFPNLDDNEKAVSQALKYVLKTYPKRFATNLSGIRRDKNKSQRELASLVGITTNSFSLWETGGYAPRISKLCLLADALNVDIGEFIQENSKNNSIPLYRAIDFNSKRVDSVDLHFLSNIKSELLVDEFNGKYDFAFKVTSSDMVGEDKAISQNSIAYCDCKCLSSTDNNERMMFANGKIALISICAGPAIIRELRFDGTLLNIRAWNPQVAEKNFPIDLNYLDLIKNKESAKFLGHETCTSSVQVFAIVKTVVLSLD